MVLGSTKSPVLKNGPFVACASYYQSKKSSEIREAESISSEIAWRSSFETKRH